jgi:hypothetical protein
LSVFLAAIDISLSPNVTNRSVPSVSQSVAPHLIFVPGIIPLHLTGLRGFCGGRFGNLSVLIIFYFSSLQPK